jgi:predicted DNA-binding transcriptional regulator AlpA
MQDDLQVIDYNASARTAGITRRTLERLIAEGQGPATIQLSSRRVGILRSDLKAWLLKRRRPVPGEDAKANQALGQDRDQEEQEGDGKRLLTAAT